jgi:uncharacterized alkaline shock family protein YloU
LVKIENHLGTITISHAYLAAVVGHAATNCFGVVGMNSSGAKQNLLSFFNKDNRIDKGVHVRFSKERLCIDLHITVMYGTNISAVVSSIANKVRYAVEEETGLQVSKINVFVDGIKY